MLAARGGGKADDVSLMATLSAGGVDLNCADEFNTTPLLEAAMYGKAKAGAWLLEHGAKVGSGDPYGNNPLHTAAQWEPSEFLTMLLKTGAGVDDKTTPAGRRCASRRRRGTTR